MKRAFVLLVPLLLLFVVNLAAQVSCNSSSEYGTLSVTCEGGDYRSATTCSGGNCTYKSWYGGYGNVHIAGEEGIRLETGVCDQACNDRLSRREERWRRLQTLLKLLSSKYSRGGNVISGYAWLESCERSSKCSQEIANDPILEQIKEVNNLVYLTQYLNDCEAYRLSVKRFHWQLDEDEKNHCSATLRPNQ